jgi:multiple sugar transport system permease protein
MTSSSETLGSPPPAGPAGAARLGWIFASPALLVVAAVMLFPIVFSIVMSFSHVNVTGNGFQLNGLTGGNYSILFGSPRYWHDLQFTVLYTVVTVLVEMTLGTLIALVLDTVLGAVGVHNLDVLGTPMQASIAMGVADVWKTTPFVAIMVLAGLVMLPGEVVEAARVDGAGGWAVFWRIRLPLLRPALAVAVMFRILQAFGLFDLPYVLTGGGPGTSTESLAVLGDKVLFNDLEFGPGAAVAASTALIVLVFCLVFLKVFRTQVGEQEQ